MPARIRSLRNGVDAIDDASRDDLVSGDIVSVQSLGAATTYNWSIPFAPEDISGNPSTATFSGISTDPSPGSFTVDHEGAYLIRLIVDQGLATEDTQYVRLRALTVSLGLTLVSAGERRDATGTIPVDVSTEGWANEQNFNLLKLQAAATSAESLADTLSVGNTTGGTDIQLDTGDKIVGQTSVSIEATGAASNVSVSAGAGGSVNVSGKVDVQTGAAETEAALGLTSTADSVALYVGAVDPTAGAGVPAPEGSLFFRGTVGAGQCWLKESASDTGWSQLSTAVAETLAQTLAAGNSTGGTDIQVDTGDEIIGQTNVVLRSTGAASNIEMNPGATGSVVVNGKLTVTGLIDPTGLVLSEQATDPASTAAGEGTFWVRDDAPNTPMFTDDSGSDWELVRVPGSGGSPVWNLVSTPGPAYAASNTEFVVITSGTFTATLPPPELNYRVAFKLAVPPVDVQIKTDALGVNIDGTDYSVTGLPVTSQWEQFSMISDGVDWFICF
jgi:hypothetical protein